MSADDRPLLSVRDLQVRFPVTTDRGKGVVQAVAGIDFDVHRGQTVSLVGESGSGKSTVANALMHLVEPSAGTVLLDGRDVTSVRGRELKALRRRIAMVFQDPFASLDPRQHVSRAVAEPLEVHGLGGDRDGRRRRVAELFEQVGLSRRFLDRYPHELSGGQRQRVAIARALAGEPDLIVLDEATASLDVSVQAQIMNLLNRLQGELGLTYLFIAHDLAVVEHMSDHVLVMYLGRLMESATQEQIYAAPGHPYHGPYHDLEYGFPITDDAALFERLVLEINQAGLSWLTILRKRENFRTAFAGFDPATVAVMLDAAAQLSGPKPSVNASVPLVIPYVSAGSLSP